MKKLFLKFLINLLSFILTFCYILNILIDYLLDNIVNCYIPSLFRNKFLNRIEYGGFIHILFNLFFEVFVLFIPYLILILIKFYYIELCFFFSLIIKHLIKHFIIRKLICIINNILICLLRYLEEELDKED